MDYSEVSALAAESEMLLGKLLEEAVNLLRNFDTYSPESLDETIRRREDILDRFLDIERQLAVLDEQAKGDEHNMLKAIMESRETLVRRIQETDSLVIALAKEQLSIIKNELAVLVKGKRALNAYEGTASVRSHAVNDSA